MTVKSLPPDQDQRNVILQELDVNLLVEAAAGTGKTTMLVSRMVALLAAGKCTPATLAAVTFTRKAAAELRTRLQVAVEKAAREGKGKAAARLRDAAARGEQVVIGTIHSFCGRLLRERPVEAGVDLEFRSVESEEDAILRAQAWESFAARLYAEDAPLLRRLEELGLELADLYAGFDSFADYPDVEEWPAEDVRLPDPGVTRVALDEYLRHMTELAPDIPEYDFKTLPGRYRILPRKAQRFDLSIARYLYGLLMDFDGDPKITMKESEWRGKAAQARPEKTRWVAFAEEVAAPFIAAFRAQRYAAVLDVYRAAYGEYENVKWEAGALNYQDLLMKAAALLRDHPAVRRYFRERFTHLLVDEFQDTDPLQAQVMLYLTAANVEERDWRRCVPVPGALFVVGDPKQSIYRFRRADIVTYDEVKRLIKRAGGRVVELSASFRAVAPLLTWINKFFGNPENGFPEQATPVAPGYVALHPGEIVEGAPFDAGPYVIAVPDEVAGRRDDAAAYDAAFVAAYIRGTLDAHTPIARTPEDLARGRPSHVTPGDFLIVTWRKYALAKYAHALQTLGVPHAVTGGTALNELAELQMLARLVGAVIHPEDPVRLVAALRSELFGVSDAALYAFRAAGGEFNYRLPLPPMLPSETAPVGGGVRPTPRSRHYFRRVTPGSGAGAGCRRNGVSGARGSRSRR